MKKINRLKALLSHQNPDSSLEKLFEKLADLALDKLDPERREARRQQRKRTDLLPASAVKLAKPSRYISPGLRDRIFIRDKGRCQFVEPRTGRKCESEQFLELDHRYPFALGGEHDEQNLQLRCRAHNQYRATELFGERATMSCESK